MEDLKKRKRKRVKKPIIIRFNFNKFKKSEEEESTTTSEAEKVERKVKETEAKPKPKQKKSTKKASGTTSSSASSSTRTPSFGAMAWSSGHAEKFTFFYKANSPFSQFHAAKFHGIPIIMTTVEDSNGYDFLHCEQWMMFHKAKLFKDEATAKKILATDKPAACKALGRKVENFDENVWIRHNEDIIMVGNRLKFTQNPLLLKALMDTDGTTLVEASPTDRIYGIGLDASHPHAQNRATWRGRNLLGQVLTRLRDELKKSEESKN